MKKILRLWKFEEVDKLYNKGISKDDKKAFLNLGYKEGKQQ
jgi:hypothetical protein